MQNNLSSSIIAVMHNVNMHVYEKLLCSGFTYRLIIWNFIQFSWFEELRSISDGTFEVPVLQT